MSESHLPPIESVTGGAHGVRAGYDQLLALAGRCEDAAATLGEMAARGARVVADPDLVASAVLAPHTFAAAETQVLDATTGPRGLTPPAVALLADALAVHACVTALMASDAAAAALIASVDHALGRMIPVGVMATLPVLAVTAPVALAGLAVLPPRQRAALTDRVVAGLGGIVHRSPALVQHLVGGGGGLVDALVPGPVGLLDPVDGPPWQATTSDAARLLAHAFGNDHEATVTEVRGIGPGPAQVRAPGDLADVIEALDHTAGLDGPSGTVHPLNGQVQVQQLGSGHDARYVVYLPGTDDMGPVPDGDDQARDMLGNYQLIGGLDTAYGRGIVEVMREAGLSGHEVMVVGHSQGGMAAAALAADPEVAAEFDIRQVVTVGSPTAQVPDLPAGTHALHLENRGDVVPLLDGRPNPDQPDRVTIRFDGGGHGVVGDHEIARYVEGARAAQSAAHPSVTAELARLRALGFLAGPEPSVAGTLRTWTVTR